MKKKYLISILALIMCFTLTACGTNSVVTDSEDVIDSTTEAQTDTSDNSELEEVELYSDSTKIVFGNGNTKLVYYYSGEKITKYEAYIDYGTAAAAQYAYSLFEKDDTIKNASVNGRYLVVEYAESVYENLTVNEVRTLYSYLEEVQNNK